MEKVRVRFAPSPTGPLHIGSARTALFNYMFARQNKGKFVLRFEDTDKDRSKTVFEENITEGLESLGIKWDKNDEYFQSERADVYASFLEKLKKQDLTYEHDGGTYFRLPSENREIIFKDIIRGTVKFESKDFDDIVLIKKDGNPTFHFANVVDDIDMKITHVIRGEDHLSNTPKHILLYKALGAEVPKFAHIPLILNEDRSKMSKRDGNVDLESYTKQGYLREALIKFLATLGWSSADEQEIFTLDELSKIFSLERVQKAGAVFDVQYLNYVNHQYLMQKSMADYYKLAKPFVAHFKASDTEMKKVLKLVQDRAKSLAEIPELIEYFFKAPNYDAKLLVFKKSSPNETAKGLNVALEVLEKISAEDWTETKLQQILDQAIEVEGLSAGDVFWPVRVALSGEKGSPSPTELLSTLGKEESLDRIKTAIKKLASK